MDNVRVRPDAALQGGFRFMVSVVDGFRYSVFLRWGGWGHFRPGSHWGIIAQKTGCKGFDEAIKKQGTTSYASLEKIGKQQMAQPETDFQLDTRRIPAPIAHIPMMQAAQTGAVAAVCRETGGLQAVDDAIAALQCPAADPHNRCNIPTAVKGHDPIRFSHQPHGQGFVKSVAGDVQSAIAMLFYAFETIEGMVLSSHRIGNITGSRLDAAGMRRHHQYPGTSGAVQNDIIDAFLLMLSKLIEMGVSVHDDQFSVCR